VTTPILRTFPLGNPWTTFDPFLFCVHHRDSYPPGTSELAPRASLSGRSIGADFSGLDGWSMYHGTKVPGFPRHPHRGFETISYMRRGYMDHADSLGAAARFGAGDVQWLTAGAGIVHSEMFPLLDPERPNPVELFQIWINLPASDKLAAPHFEMLWAEDIPLVGHIDGSGQEVETTIVAGTLDGYAAPSPPPDSWASRADHEVAIWHVRLQPEATWSLPPAVAADVVRTVYVHEGGSVALGGEEVAVGTGAVVATDREIAMRAGAGGAECLVLQGRPIGEPVAQHGPFVMNDRAGLEQAWRDYQTTEFGGWPWPVADPDHGSEPRRFARHADGAVSSWPR
jgi:hypothetical protein